MSLIHFFSWIIVLLDPGIQLHNCQRIWCMLTMYLFENLVFKFWRFKSDLYKEKTLHLRTKRVQCKFPRSLPSIKTDIWWRSDGWNIENITTNISMLVWRARHIMIIPHLKKFWEKNLSNNFILHKTENLWNWIIFVKILIEGSTINNNLLQI